MLFQFSNCGPGCALHTAAADLDARSANQRHHMHGHDWWLAVLRGKLLRELHNDGDGVQEDPLHLILNVKGVVFRMQDRDEVRRLTS